MSAKLQAVGGPNEAHARWTSEERAAAHADLDVCLDHCDYAVIVGVGRTQTFEKWFASTASNMLTLQILGMLQKVVLRGFQREIENEESRS